MLKLLLLVTLFKQITFSAVTPLWHGPDEQAHFAQVQYIAEFGRPVANDNKVKDLSQEIFISEQLLGTARDEFGKNKFTHRPDYRLEYTLTTIGKYEPLINYQPASARTTFVKFEATRYPPLFYYLSAAPYRLGYHLGLIDRVFLARVASMLMAVATVWLVYKIGLWLFPKSNLLPLTLATLVSFQPMASFLFSSVNSDNLMNLLFTLALYWCVKLIATRRLTLPTIIGLSITVAAGLFTKPHFVIIFPILLTLPLFVRRLPIILMSLGLMVLMLVRFFAPFPEISASAFTNPVNPVSWFEHLRWSLRHTIAEVIPWYWGVFNWLGITLPRTVNRIINRILIIAAAGFLIYIWKRKFSSSLIFLQTSALIFFLVLMTWDWLFVRSHGFSFGMQGRYYFPLIVSHMAFLLVGWSSLIHKSWWIKLFGLGMILLNFIGLKTLAQAYYQLWPLTVFFNQVSQYKPIYFKFPYLLIWFTLYLVSLVIFLVKYLSYADRQRSRV